MRSAIRLIILAQVSLWLFLLVCCLLMPHFLLESDEGGVSNYGTYGETIVPYTLAFGLCGVLALQAARIFSPHTVRRRSLRRLLFTAGWLYLFALESTYLYQVNGWLDTVHILAGTLLLLFETAAAVWLDVAFVRDALQDLLLAVQFAGFILAVLTFFGALHVLFVAEVLTNLGFGMLLIRVVLRQAEPARPGVIQ